MKRRPFDLCRVGGDPWHGWTLKDGILYDPEGTAHTPATIRVWHFTRQLLQEYRAHENQRSPEVLPANVRALSTYRYAHRLTEWIHSNVNPDAA